MRGVHHVTRISGLFVSANVVAVTTFVDPGGSVHRVTTHVIKPSSFLRVFIDAPLTRYRGQSMGKLCTGTHQKRVGGFAKVSTPFRIPRRPTLSLSASMLSLRRSIGQLLRVILPQMDERRWGVSRRVVVGVGRRCGLDRLGRLRTRSVRVVHRITTRFRGPIVLCDVKGSSSIVMHLTRGTFCPNGMPFPLVRVSSG